MAKVYPSSVPLFDADALTRYRTLPAWLAGWLAGCPCVHGVYLGVYCRTRMWVVGGDVGCWNGCGMWEGMG